MVKYKLIIEYYQKGNNNSQIATLCGCSRTVVWEVLNRFNKIETIFADIQRMSEEELRILLFPERVKKGKGYLIPDFKWEEFQMRKHQSSLRLCWRRYCKRAAKQNLKAYSWASFGLFYIQYRKPCSDEDDPNDKVRNKLKHYNLLMSFCDPGSESYRKLQKEKDEWLKSLSSPNCSRSWTAFGFTSLWRLPPWSSFGAHTSASRSLLLTRTRKKSMPAIWSRTLLSVSLSSS